jgi:methyl coenzyme M reductase beta subunit
MGSLTRESTLTTMMKRLVAIREIAADLASLQGALTLVVIGGQSVQLSRHLLLQVFEAEEKHLAELVGRMLTTGDAPKKENGDGTVGG